MRSLLLGKTSTWVSYLLGSLALLTTSHLANAYENKWLVSGEGTDVVAVDCRDCEEDLGIIIACTGNGQPANITVNAAASERGQDGAFAPVTFTIGRQNFTYEAKTIYFGAIGYTPEFQIAYDDPLIEALSAGQRAFLSFNGHDSYIDLNGSRNVLNIFKEQCGWTPSGFQNNLQQTAAANPTGGQNRAQLPVFNQQQPQPQQPPAQQPQAQQQGQLPVFGQQSPTPQIVQNPQPQLVQPQGQLPVFNQQNQQPVQQVPQQQVVQNPQLQQPQLVQPQGQLPAFNQQDQQAQQQQVVPQQVPQQQTQPIATVYGVQPGQVHTQPNADGVLWFTSQFATQSGLKHQITYGIPETDARFLGVSCSANTGNNYNAELFLDVSIFGNNQQTRVEFSMNGQPAVGLNGTVFKENEEYAGVRLTIPTTAPFWGMLSNAQSVSFGIQGQPKVTIPGAGVAGQFFAAQCSRNATQLSPSVQSQSPQQPTIVQQIVPQQIQPALQQIPQQVQQQVQPIPQQVPQQTQQPVQQIQPQTQQLAQVQLNKTFSVVCASGASWQIRFENQQGRTVALLHPGASNQLIMEPVATPTGQGYRNGPLTVYPEGNQLKSDYQGNISVCPMK